MKTPRLDLIFTRLGTFLFVYIFFKTLIPMILFPETLNWQPPTSLGEKSQESTSEYFIFYDILS